MEHADVLASELAFIRVRRGLASTHGGDATDGERGAGEKEGVCGQSGCACGLASRGGH